MNEARTVLFVVGQRREWEELMDPLAALARDAGGGVRVLCTAAPIGTGMFTSNPVMDDDYPVETFDEPSRVNPADRRTAGDTGDAARETNAYLEGIAAALEARGVPAAWDWQPEFERERLAEYARGVGAGTIALVKRNPVTEWLFQRPHVQELERAGFRVVELEPHAR